jgi:DNA invertase Pin-like site-specific DNA recombinase
MRAIGYTRVSSLEQAECGVSQAVQADRIRAYCDLQGWECIDVVSDDGYSGKDLKRPGIQRLLDEAARKKARRFDAVLVVKLDRLTRSMKDLLTLTTIADRHGLTLVSIQEAVDTATATGQLFRTIITALSEWERGTIGERTREALAFKRQQGERVGAIPFGFKLADDGKHLVPIPSETAILAQICRERRAGASFDAIATRLNDRSVRTKCGGVWYAASVRSVLMTAQRRDALGRRRLRTPSRDKSNRRGAGGASSDSEGCRGVDGVDQ